MSALHQMSRTECPFMLLYILNGEIASEYGSAAVLHKSFPELRTAENEELFADFVGRAVHGCAIKITDMTLVCVADPSRDDVVFERVNSIPPIHRDMVRELAAICNRYQIGLIPFLDGEKPRLGLIPRSGIATELESIMVTGPVDFKLKAGRISR